MAIIDQNGYDILEGIGANRSKSASQHAPIFYAASSAVGVCIDDSDALTLLLGNNIIAGATLSIDLYYATGA